MERLTSRKSAVIRAFRDLARSSAAREEKGLFLCDGQKLLQEALHSGASVETVLWKENRAADLPPFPQEALLPADLFDYVSPMSNSPGPLFSVRMPSAPDLYKIRRVLALEELQDPGNVGTVLRTADAFGVDLVVNPDYASANNLLSLRRVADRLENCYIVPCDLWMRENPFSSVETHSWYMV